MIEKRRREPRGKIDKTTFSVDRAASGGELSKLTVSSCDGSSIDEENSITNHEATSF